MCIVRRAATTARCVWRRKPTTRGPLSVFAWPTTTRHKRCGATAVARRFTCGGGGLRSRGLSSFSSPHVDRSIDRTMSPPPKKSLAAVVSSSKVPDQFPQQNPQQEDAGGTTAAGASSWVSGGRGGRGGCGVFVGAAALIVWEPAALLCLAPSSRRLRITPRRRLCGHDKGRLCI